MRNIFYSLLAIGLLLLFTVSCKKNNPDPIPSTAFESKHGDSLSHRNGEVCLTCHVTGGSASKSFVVAGSVYQADYSTPSPNGTLYFWTQTGGTGTLAATLQVDREGNFFTTSSILPGSGTFPQIRGTSSDIRNMPILAPNGNCNSCHGVTENPVWVN